MADKVTIVNNYPPKSNQEVLLHNGDLVIINKDKILMVSTYGKESLRPSSGAANKYCSLINLKDGSRAFSEPCSRKTTIARIIDHFRFHPSVPWDVDSFEVAPKDSYNLDIVLKLPLQGGLFE